MAVLALVPWHVCLAHSVHGVVNTLVCVQHPSEVFSSLESLGIPLVQ